MIEWLPDVCGQLHDEMVQIYWMLLLPLIVLLVVIELFKTSSGQPDAGKIIVRGVVSIILLISFIDTNTPLGSAVFTILGAVAHYAKSGIMWRESIKTLIFKLVTMISIHITTASSGRTCINSL